VPEDENTLREHIVEKITLLISQTEAETDPLKKEEYRRELDELNCITSEL
jgi:hypothetical protein